jgi:leucyl-tRNA synthetase
MLAFQSSRWPNPEPQRVCPLSGRDPPAAIIADWLLHRRKGCYFPSIAIRMQEKYSPAEIEAAAQAHWRATNADRVLENATDKSGALKPKFYACSMLPYPSGKLHMGHVRNYTINDVMTRYMRMRGYNVLMPMGWDAFGLPAENAAIEKGVAPAEWTYANIADMKAQMQPLGLAFDWSREIAACDPKYYKWNQWFFLKMLEKGVAYRKTQVVNWDPQDRTVLANEQVVDGRGWRTGAIVEKREIPGYYLRITDYAEELRDSVVENLPGWPERVRVMQENWIGKSDGVRFAFPHLIRNAAGELIGDGKLYVFTTRADTIMGATFCAVAPEHPLATHAATTDPALASFIEECKRGGTSEAEVALREKLGMATGLAVTHPLTGASIPVWVGNYVLMTYGDGAVMGVPAHDERDLEFAHKYDLPIRQVIAVEGQIFDPHAWQEWYGDKTAGRCIASGELDGLPYREAVNRVAELLAAKGLGELRTTYRLRDWGISRQRYWGTPIPMIHCPACGTVPVPEADLPVILPEDLVPDGSGNPLTTDRRFLDCICPGCGGSAERETDTMDTFVDSAWYYMRYCCSDNDQAMVDERCDYWMPMDQYIGGIEHAVLHLLYARFWTKVMRDIGLVKFDEPFTRLFTQGMLLNDSFYREDETGKKRWFYPTEVELKLDDKGKVLGAVAKEDGAPVMLGGVEKMSKSKNNVVEPRDIMARYGADTARLFSMFAGPPEDSAIWSDASVEGANRFLRGLWAFCHTVANTPAIARHLERDSSPTPSGDARKLRHEIYVHFKQVSEDYSRLKYNTVVSGAMKILNALTAALRRPETADDSVTCQVIAEGVSLLLRALYPVTPHIAHSAWQALRLDRVYGEIVTAPWPAIDKQALVQDEIELVVQVNGTLRSTIRIPANASQQEIEVKALADDHVQKFVTGPVKKIWLVPGRLINIVV